MAMGLATAQIAKGLHDPARQFGRDADRKRSQVATTNAFSFVWRGDTPVAPYTDIQHGALMVQAGLAPGVPHLTNLPLVSRQRAGGAGFAGAAAGHFTNLPWASLHG